MPPGWTWVDLLLSVALTASALVGLWRGLVRELVSLLAWVAAFLLALRYGPTLAAALPEAVAPEALRRALAFLAVGLGVLAAGAVGGRLLRLLVRGLALGGLDRWLGLLFGALRGAVLALALVHLGGLSPLAEVPAWRGSWWVGTLQPWVRELAARLPPGPWGRARPG